MPIACPNVAADQNLRPVSHNKIGRNDPPEKIKTSLKHGFYVLGRIFGDRFLGIANPKTPLFNG